MQKRWKATKQKHYTQLMQKKFERDYPETVYENAWEDLMVIRESWKSVHGVDDQFCIELINEFANYIKNDIIS